MPKTNSRILRLIVSVSFIFFSLLGSIHFWCFNESFYKSEHDKLILYGKHISEYIGISDEDLQKLTHFTLAYLNDPKATLDIQMEVKGKTREIFTDDEKAHMVDVQKLNLTANYLLIGSGVVFAISMILYIVKKYSFSELFLSYKRVLLYVLVFVGCIGMWILIDFDSFWTFFHHVFFSQNDLWLLDLRKDVLIMIVPPEFFFHLVTAILLTFIGILLAYNIALYVIDRIVRENDKRRVI